MKGLLLKDAYNIQANCRTYFIMVALFSVVSFMIKDDAAMFWIFYPCVLASMIPVSLLSVDERERWNVYERCLPYTAKQIVTVKYLVGLVSGVMVVILIAVPRGIQALVLNQFYWNEFLFLVMLLVLCTLNTPLLLLPFVFKLGVEKGKILYYFFVGVIFGVSVALVQKGSRLFSYFSNHPMNIAVIFGVTVLLYIGSWRLSVHFYKNREI